MKKTNKLKTISQIILDLTAIDRSTASSKTQQLTAGKQSFTVQRKQTDVQKCRKEGIIITDGNVMRKTNYTDNYALIFMICLYFFPTLPSLLLCSNRLCALKNYICVLRPYISPSDPFLDDFFQEGGCDERLRRPTRDPRG